MKTSAELRQSYLDFFAKRSPPIVPSAPLVPHGDQSLMFNSAGMVPFKPYFLGLKRDLSRAASCQKCLRTTDIDRVGATARHLTFFEMLGNFSFGDYFKAEAISWAWEFLTKELGLDANRLYPTVFKDDEDALALWKKQGTPNAPSKLGADTNFWDMGPTGPCGPCSEIYFDRGVALGCGKPDCAPGCDCDRYMEVWNLVFTQFDRQQDKSLKDLPRKNIDTGMGLERLAVVVQGADSAFGTDLFKPLSEKACALLGMEPGASAQAQTGLRVIADHARASVMLMTEGLIPSNIERGYVLRRLIRRAARYGRILGAQEPFLYKLVPTVAEIFSQAYPEVSSAAETVAGALQAEEERFAQTLESGEKELERLLERSGKTLAGEAAFKLHDTFGFPLELTREIAAGRGVAVDEAGFRRAEEKAVEIARASWKGSGAKAAVVGWEGRFRTEFTGYHSLEEKAKIAAFEPKIGARPAVLILDKTPFYAEGGGQVGDTGEILSADGKIQLARVTDTQKQGEAVFHILADENAKALAAGAAVLARVDAARRARVVPHHTATHLLNAALRRILGPHVRQAGSYVGPDKLRFDFTHPKPLGAETLRQIEQDINAEIAKSHPVWTKEDAVEKAQEYGAVTLLGEDYGARPRFVLVNAEGWSAPKERFSLELCGGTHAKNTADLRAFRILKESSVSAGVRRIEAVAGAAAGEYEEARAQEDAAARGEILARTRDYISQIKAEGGKADILLREEAGLDALREQERKIKDVLASLKAKRIVQASKSWTVVLEKSRATLRLERLEGADPKSLRGLADKGTADIGSGLAFVASIQGGKISFVLAATPDLVAQGFDAAKIAKALALARGGSAGGRAEFAQGGMAEAEWDGVASELARLADQKS